MIRYVVIILNILLLFACSVSPKPDFSFIYLANLNGNLENCNCGNPSLGGLDRIAKIINNQRKINPDIKFIDGGLTFNSYPFPDLDYYIFQSYKYLKPDIWIIRKKDLETIKNISSSEKNESLNISLVTGDTLKLVKKYEINGLNIYFYSLQQLAVKDTIIYKDIDRDDFNILIYCNPEGLNSVFKPFYKFDLILLSHNQKKVIENGLYNTIAGVGSDGEFILKVDLYFQNNDFKKDIEQIAIYKDLEVDSTVNQIIKEFSQKLKETNGE